MLEQKPWIDTEPKGTLSPAEFLRRLPEGLTLEQFWDFVNRSDALLFSHEFKISGERIIIGARTEGGYASVFFGWYDKIPLRFVVVKMPHSSYINNREVATRLTLEKFFFEQQEATDPHSYWPSLLDEGTVTHPLTEPFTQTQPHSVDCMVVELIPGLMLGTIIDRYPNITENPAFAAAVGMQIVHGLQNLHACGLVYRDVKPENILITYPAPGKPFVRLFDANAFLFPDSDLTDPGIVIGTAEYASPEQIRDERIGPESDYYAVGCLLYEMIRGYPPFRGFSGEISRRHLRDQPEPLDSPLWPVISRLLAKNPRERYETNEEVRRALQGFVLEDQALMEYARPALL